MWHHVRLMPAWDAPGDVSSKAAAVLMPLHTWLVKPLEQREQFPSLVFKTDEFRQRQEGTLIRETSNCSARADYKCDSFCLGKTDVHNDGL